MAAAALSVCYSLTPKLSHNQATPALSLSRTTPFLSRSLSSLTLTARKHPALSFTVKLTDTEAPVSVIEPEIETSAPESEVAVETEEPKREEVFAVVMVSREGGSLCARTPILGDCSSIVADFSAIYDGPDTDLSSILSWKDRAVDSGNLTILLISDLGFPTYPFSPALVNDGNRFIALFIDRLRFPSFSLLLEIIVV